MYDVSDPTHGDVIQLGRTYYVEHFSLHLEYVFHIE